MFQFLQVAGSSCTDSKTISAQDETHLCHVKWIGTLEANSAPAAGPHCQQLHGHTTRPLLPDLLHPTKLDVRLNGIRVQSKGRHEPDL